MEYKVFGVSRGPSESEWDLPWWQDSFTAVLEDGKAPGLNITKPVPSALRGARLASSPHGGVCWGVEVPRFWPPPVNSVVAVTHTHLNPRPWQGVVDRALETVSGNKLAGILGIPHPRGRSTRVHLAAILQPGLRYPLRCRDRGVGGAPSLSSLFWAYARNLRAGVVPSGVRRCQFSGKSLTPTASLLAVCRGSQGSRCLSPRRPSRRAMPRHEHCPNRELAGVCWYLLHLLHLLHFDQLGFDCGWSNRSDVSQRISALNDG